MKLTPSHFRVLSRARFHRLHALAAAALLLAGLPAASRADILYVTLNNNTIDKITSAAAGSVFASTGLSAPNGLAFDSAGNLYAANQTSNTIRKFSPGGTDLGVFASTGLSGPTGLAFDSAGNLYAANSGTNTIEKYTPGGTDLGGFVGIFLSGPFGLAFDSAGNLYAASTTTVEKFSPNGNDLGVFFNSTSVGGGNTRFLAFTTDAGVPLPLANQAPEPATCALLLLGGLGMLAARRPRSARATA